MDALNLRATKLTAERHAAQSTLARTMKEVRAAKQKESEATSSYQRTVERILRDPVRLARATAQPKLLLAELKAGRHKMAMSMSHRKEVTLTAKKEREVVTKLSEKLEALAEIRVAQKKLGLSKRENLVDEELSELSALNSVGPRIDIQQSSDCLAVSEVGRISETRQSSPKDPVSPQVVGSISSIEPSPIERPSAAMPIVEDLHVSKTTSNEVSVGFTSDSGDRVSLAVTQLPNGSVSLSWRGNSGHTREVQAIESMVLRRLRESGIRSSPRRGR